MSVGMSRLPNYLAFTGFWNKDFGEGAASMDQSSKANTNERPIHRACLVAGCPCKAEGSLSARPVALVATTAASNGEIVGRHRSPDLAWRFVGLPIA